MSVVKGVDGVMRFAGEAWMGHLDCELSGSTFDSWPVYTGEPGPEHAMQPCITPYIAPYIPQEVYPNPPLTIKIKTKTMDEPEERREGIMKVFEVTKVDTKKLEVMGSEKVIAESKDKVGLMMMLTGVERHALQNGTLDLIIVEIGEFRKFTKRVKVVDEGEE